MNTTPATTAKNRDHQQHQHFDPQLAAAAGQFQASIAPASSRTAPGMLARMPAMINKLMPLPMPNSSICSPSHIRKTVPAVIVSDGDHLPAEGQVAGCVEKLRQHHAAVRWSDSRRYTQLWPMHSTTVA